MNRLLATALLGVLALIALPPAAVDADAPLRLQPEPRRPVDLSTGQIIVRFEQTATPSERASLHAQLGGRLVRAIDALGLQVVAVPDGTATGEVARAYAASPLVTFAEIDAVVPLADAPSTPNDPYYSFQWQHEAIDSPEAWTTTTGDSAWLVTICDTGVSATHPDLIANLRADLGYNSASGGSDWSPVHYHGTAVAGAAAAVGNNGTGIAGVSHAAGIVPVRVSNRSDGNASISALADCIRYGADVGSIAVNLSYTTYTSGGVSPTILAAAEYASERGTVVVIAAGNANEDAAPADDPESILYVSATNSGNGKASFSNYGASIDVAAPGESVVSTYSEVTCRGRNCQVTFEDYAYVSGTSFAAPIVAGAVALVANAHGSTLASLEGPAQAAFLRDTITAGACDLGAPGEDALFGAGLLNVHAAVHGTACTNPIPAPTLDAVLVSPILATVYADGQQQFTATALWSDGATSDVTAESSWSTSDPAVAAVDGSGAATGLAAGTATITATLLVDGSPVSGNAVLTVTDAPPAGTVASVAAIEYALSGGPNQDRNLEITVTVRDDLDSPVEGAALQIWLQNLSTGQLWIGDGVTDAQGRETFTLRRAPSGAYTTLVASLSADGLSWDSKTPENAFVKP